MMNRRQLIAGLAAGSAIALAGCETVELLDTQGEIQTASQSSENSLVFGRVRWIENGQEREMDQSMFGWWIKPRLKRLQDGKIMHGEVDTVGRFRWSLPPGTYVIDRINYRDPGTGMYFIIPKVAFDVPEANKIYYAGTLRADSVAERGFWGVQGATKFSIQDNYRQELGTLRQTFNIEPSRVSKNLMVQNDKLPDSLDSTAESQVALTILGAIL